MVKVFVITGASSGLGEAMTKVIIDKSNHKVVSLSRKITDEQKCYDKNRFKFIKTDFLQNDLMQSLMALKNELHSSKIVFINNAAIINPIDSIGHFKTNQINHSLKVNVKTPTIIINFVISELKLNLLGMINISSGASNLPISGWSLYCAGKSYMEAFFNVMKIENPNIIVKSIDPGVMNTNMQKTIRESMFHEVEYFNSLFKSNELKHPEVVARKIISSFL